MNRRQFLLGAAAVPIAAVGQQERFLFKTLGVPTSVALAESSIELPVWARMHLEMKRTMEGQRQAMLLMSGYALAVRR